VARARSRFATLAHAISSTSPNAAMTMPPAANTIGCMLGAHHFAAMSQPDVVNARIVSFLKADQRKGND
jgi:hypothetical protein